DVRGGVPLPGHRLLVVALDVVRPDLALAVHLRLEVGEPGRHGGATGREAPILADQLRHRGGAVAADVEGAEREPAPLRLRRAAHFLARRVHPAELEISPHRPREALDERLVLGEVDGAEIAHAPFLRSFSRGAGGREPSGYAKS